MFNKFIFSGNSYEKVTELNNSTCKVGSVSQQSDIPTITSQKKLLNKILKAQIFTTCFLSIFLSMNHDVLAGYEPPKEQKAPTGHSDSSGIRVGYKTNIEKNAGIPIKKIDSFAWLHTDKQPVARQMNLYEFNISSNNLPVVEADIYSETGIHYVAQNIVLLSTSREAIDKIFVSLFAKLSKLEKKNITCIPAKSL